MHGWKTRDIPVREAGIRWDVKPYSFTKVIRGLSIEIQDLIVFFANRSGTIKFYHRSLNVFHLIPVYMKDCNMSALMWLRYCSVLCKTTL